MNRLLQHAPCRIAVRALPDRARQHAHRLAMKIIALELHALLTIEQHPVHMAGTVHQPVDGMPVRPHSTSPVVEFVVFVMPMARNGNDPDLKAHF
ncbi:hypothetical protein ABID76_001127 [Burkholderia ambifaria]